LFDGEAEREAEVQRIDLVFGVVADLDEEGVDTVCHVVWKRRKERSRLKKGAYVDEVDPTPKIHRREG
jgi:hypothetical protein